MGLFNKAFKRANAKANDNPSEKKDIPSWLKMLQDNSWELEIIISGGAIFSLFQLSELATDFTIQASYSNMIGPSNFWYIMCLLAINGLILSFGLHIVLRSFWVSLIALSSMFGEKNENKKIKLAKPFKSDEKTGLTDLIIKVNKSAAWMMYNSFTITIVIIGITLLFFSIITIMNLMPSDFPIADGLAIFILVVLAFYYADFLLFSVFRKIPYLSYILYPFFKVFDLISLRFLYQKGFDYVSQNIPKWKVALFYIGFIFCTVFFTNLFTRRSLNMGYQSLDIFDNRKYKSSLTKSDTMDYNPIRYEYIYRDKPEVRKGHHSVSIQSDIIADPVLVLFIHYTARYDAIIEQIKNPKDRFFENIWQISVDDSTYNNLIFYPIRGNNPGNVGITTYINVGNFNQGPHVINITSIFKDISSGGFYYPQVNLYIPFWLDKEADQ